MEFTVSEEVLHSRTIACGSAPADARCIGIASGSHVLSQVRCECPHEFWDDLMGCFVEHMGKHARCGCNPKRDHTMKNTAPQRSSGLKEFLANRRFRNELLRIPIWQKEQWSKLLSKIDGFCRESSRREGKHDTEEVSSTHQD